jgi:protein SCO1
MPTRWGRTAVTPAKWMLYSAAILLLSIIGCRSKTQTQERRYHLKGTVVQVDKPQQHLVIDHEEIPGFMAAMTMPYPVVDSRVLDQITPGDQITADVVVNDAGVRLENIVVVKKSDGKSSPAGQLAPPNQIRVPAFTLVNQNGKAINVTQYRGKSVLLTFIYTRCPLPEYCPLVTHNFAEIEKALAQMPELYAKTHLLSISFDSQYDTPEILRSYSRRYLPDRGKLTFTHWEFATIPASEKAAVTRFFNVFLSGQDGQITHSMSTAIISPDGELYRSYSSNDWRPADVLTDLAQSTSSQFSSHLGAALNR